jgi:uncharacterized RDD family membrane protein YckC
MAEGFSQTRTLVTPEGVDLRVRIATAGERAVALIIDLVIIYGSLLLSIIVAGLLGIGALLQQARIEAEIIAIAWMLGSFLWRNFYFTFMEAGPRAATWGKRIMGLRVAARSGGVLKADAVFARNAMREIELYLPMTFLITQGQDIEGLIVLCGVLWCAVFVFFPLFNRDRLRLGDVIAGTWVIKAPKHKLLPDIATEGANVSARFVFSEKQLDQYGVKELQVLENVLRHADAAAIEAVADRIRTKINWRRAPSESDIDFLNAYYVNLRRRLEQRLLFGVRKRDKHDDR